MTSKNLAVKIANIALEKKGKEIKILDLTGLAFFTDFFVIISGDSDIHIKAISDHIETKLKENKIKIEKIKKQLPDNCPVCNQPIKEELL